MTGLIGQILGGRPHLAISTDQPGRDSVTSLHHALAKLAVAGVPIRFDALWEGYQRPARPSAPARSAASVQVLGANYGRPSPPPVPAPPPTTEPTPEVMPEMPTPDYPPHTAADGWLAAFQEVQRQTAEVHGIFQQTMADAHLA